MLTPAFNLKQDDFSITAIIQAKYAKIAETEIFFEDSDFKFYSKPYYLRLNLPGRVKSVEDSNPLDSASYNVDSGEFTIRMEKQNHGETFEGLDLITKLLTPVRKKTNKPLIEVIGESNNSATADEIDDDEEFDWQIEQSPFVEASANPLVPQMKYGFANQYSGILGRFQDEGILELDVKNPDSKSNSQRHEERLERESIDFNEDHYLADYFEDDHIRPLLNFKCPWNKIIESMKKDSSLNADDVVVFTEKEFDRMKNLPKKSYLFESTDSRAVCLGLVDIIFAFAYQYRTTEGDQSVESSWTITKLSPTLSWLETHSSLKNTLVSCMRRSLCYPLFRHWELSQTVLEDTRQLFRLGRKQLLKCLLEIHALFVEFDNCYILNDLYITDYCVWIQQVRNKALKSIADSLQEVKISKRSLNLDLEELEDAGRLVKDEEETSQAALSGSSESSGPVLDEVCQNLEQLDIKDVSTTTTTTAAAAATTKSKGRSRKIKTNIDVCSSSDTRPLEVDGCESDSSKSSCDSGDYYLDSDDQSSDDDNTNE